LGAVNVWVHCVTPLSVNPASAPATTVTVVAASAGYVPAAMTAPATVYSTPVVAGTV
jgi:hypothetical protein